MLQSIHPHFCSISQTAASQNFVFHIPLRNLLTHFNYPYSHFASFYPAAIRHLGAPLPLPTAKKSLDPVLDVPRRSKKQLQSQSSAMASEDIRSSLKIAIVGGGVGGGSYFLLNQNATKPHAFLYRLRQCNWLKASWLQACRPL